MHSMCVCVCIQVTTETTENLLFLPVFLFRDSHSKQQRTTVRYWYVPDPQLRCKLRCEFARDSAQTGV